MSKFYVMGVMALFLLGLCQIGFASAASGTSMVKGIWLDTNSIDAVDVAKLKNTGITDVYVEINDYNPSSYKNILNSVLSKFKGSGIRVNVWIKCFIDPKTWPFKWYDPADQKHQTYLLDLISDITKNYNIDGINLDYLRYNDETNEAAEHPDAPDVIAAFVKKVSGKVHSIKPNVKVSADLWPPASAPEVGQDYEKLAPHLDQMIPMLYKGLAGQDTAWIGECTKIVVSKAGETPVIAGILTYESDDNPVILPQSELNQDTSIALKNGAKGYVLFCYGSSNLAS